MLRFFLGFGIALLLSANLSAEIQECYSSQAILSEIDENTLVLVDIDKTSVKSATHLGSEAWHKHLQKKTADWGISDSVLVPLVTRIMQNTVYIAVEKTTPGLIAELQAKKHLIFAFTGRLMVAPWDPQFSRATHNHLKAAGINFELTHIPAQFAHKKFPSSFAHGIIFSNWQPKGPVLKHFLTELDHHPAKVVLIDDQLSFLHSVEKSMAEMKIPFVGFHYRLCEKEEREFDPLIANIQLQHLEEKGSILSERKALLAKKRLLKRKPSINPDFYLDKLFIDLVEKQMVVR